MKTTLIIALIITLLALLSNVVSTWIEPFLTKWRKITVLSFVALAIFSVLFIDEKKIKNPFLKSTDLSEGIKKKYNLNEYSSTQTESANIESVKSEIFDKYWNEKRAMALIKKWGIEDEYNEFIGFFPISSNGKDVILGLGYHPDDENRCRCCFGIISIYEFYREGKEWKTLKSYAEEISGGLEMNPSYGISIISIGNNIYAISIEGGCGQGGQSDSDVTLYAKIGEKYKKILEIPTHSSYNNADYTESESDINYSWNVKIIPIKEGRGYYDLKIIKKGIGENGDNIDEQLIYKFNGQSYGKSKIY